MAVARGSVEVVGDGPQPAQIMVSGEAPGPRENRAAIRGDAKQNFVGASGYFLDFMASRILRIPRKHLRVNNVCRWMPPRENDGGIEDPEPKDLARDYPRWLEDLEATMPELILAVGRFALWQITGVDPAKYTMEVAHGMTFYEKNYGIPVIPMYHFAAGLRDSSKMGKTMWALKQARRWLDGEHGERRNRREVRKDGYRLVESEEDIVRMVASVWDGEYPPAIDTEGYWWDPWCVQVSSRPGESFIVMAGDDAGLRELSEVLSACDTVILHYAEHDLPVLEAMGIRLDLDQIDDTATRAYLNRMDPLSLKKLVRRYFAWDMREYSDVIGPIHQARMYQFFGEMLGDELEPLDTKYTKAGNPYKKQKVAEFTRLGERIYKALQDVDARGLRSVDEQRHKSKPVDLQDRWKRMLKDFPHLSNGGYIAPKTGLTEVPRQEFIDYAGADPDGTLQIWIKLKEQTERDGHEELLKIDLGALPMFARMQTVGFELDQEDARKFSKELQRKAERFRGELAWMAQNPDFNPGSHYEMIDLLYKKLRYRVVRRTGTGDPSTDEKSLAMLRQKKDHPVFDALEGYREAKKFDSTYVQALLRDCWADGRVRPDLDLRRTHTGRVAGMFLTIPAHSEDGKRIRRLLRAKEGCRLMTADLSQIEMRILAHASNDENMIRIFNEDGDVHDFSASKMWGIPIDEVDRKTQRLPAKTTGFGIVFGETRYGLKMNLSLPPPQGPGLDYTLEEAQELIELWLGAFPGVKELQRKIINELRGTGEVRGLFGRVRYLPTVWSPDERLSAEAERAAINHPIQDGAQCLEKIAMRMLWERDLPEMWAQGLYVEPLLQVHDELIFEVEEAAEEEWEQRIIERLVEAGKDWLKVPVKAGGVWGSNWGDLQKS